jgi:ATP-dependent RNA circularization protein (DNA/RNA ligase family)
MIAVLRKFPKTPHVLWLSRQAARGDKVMTPTEAQAFISSGKVLVEEKVDGANLGLSFDEAGRLRAQNRGNFLEGKLRGQWHGLCGWLAQYEPKLRKHLPSGAVLYGEWCYAQHSMAYTRLPDWFLGFDVLDASDRFWSTRRRDALFAAAGLAPIRCMARRRFTLHELRAMLSEPSAYGNGPVEGIYLRREDDGWLLQRAKLVRPEFVQAIGEHWSRRPLHVNQLLSAA